MTWKDKLEIGLKEDAPFRRDNLPEFQRNPETPETRPDDPTRSPEEPGAREAAEAAQDTHELGPLEPEAGITCEDGRTPGTDPKSASRSKTRSRRPKAAE